MNSIAQEFRFFSLLKFAFPTIVMMVFVSLYTIIDGIFVSRLLGSNALSAVNIVYPVISLVIAFGIMIASGGSAIVAKQFGEKREREACINFSFLTVVGIVFGGLILLFGIIFLEPICRVLGATDLLLEYCEEYLKTLLYFAPISILQMIFQTFFVTAGKPGLGLILTSVGGITNMVLDYVLIKPMQMGIVGAALATGLGQTVVVLGGIVYFLFFRKGLKFVLPKFHGRVLLQSCSNGASEMVSNLSTAVVTFLFNLIMLKLAGEDGVAAITIVLYGQFLFTSMYLGFSMGVAPVFSYHYGDQNEDQLKRLFRICTRFIVISSVVITVAALCFASAIVGIFVLKGSHTYELALRGFLLFSINYIFAGVNIFASSMFTAFSNGKISAVISFFRTFILIVISVLLLPMILGVDGVWLSIPIAELLTIVISIWYFYTQKDRYHYG